MSLLELRIFGICGAVLALWIGYGLWHHKVWQEGYDARETLLVKSVEEGKKQYEKTSIEVQRLPDDALRREFCKWVRDADVSGCLKSLAPFRP